MNGSLRSGFFSAIALTFTFCFFSLTMTIPAVGVQRFFLDTDELNNYETKKHKKPILITPGTLVWNGMRIDPIRNYNQPNLIEYICAQDNSTGPDLLRGQRVTLAIQKKYALSKWEEQDPCSQCVIGGLTVCCCPIALPMFACLGMWTPKDVITITESIGQIEFSTEQQPRAVRLRLGQETKSLFLTAEN